MFIGRFRLFVLCLGTALVAGLGHASTITYSDPNAWASATTGTSEITFEGIAPPGSFTNEGTSTGLTIDGTQFIGQLTASTYMLNVTDQLYAPPYFNWNEPATLESPIYNLPADPTFVPYIHVVLPSNTTAFAALLGTVSPNSLSYEVTLSDGETFTVGTSARPTLTFFGVTTDDPITYANFTLLNPGTFSGSYGILTNFQVGTSDQSGGGSGQTPEACTLILIGSGLVALRAFRNHLPAFG
jgi:hypothetical protein